MRSSPTARLLAGLAITLTVAAVFSLYTAGQIRSLRELQRTTIERNRRDSLQLLRIQNNLNALGLAMRDMIEGAEPYPLTAWQAQFARIRADLEDALTLEAQFASERPPEQQTYLASSFTQFWDAVDRMFAAARGGEEKTARNVLSNSLTARLSALTNTVARLLVLKKESGERTVAEIGAIYERVERNVYLFLAAAPASLAATSIYLIQSSRRMFDRLAALSEQRSELARKLISTQEEALRSVSRELHDEFGQVLTAVGAMLRRVEKRRSEMRSDTDDQDLAEQLRETRQVAQDALDRVRRLSQVLHPVMLEETGLVSTIEWYLPQFEKQTGVTVRYERIGDAAVDQRTAVHVYRVLQEALNNVARHSGASEAAVRLEISGSGLSLDIEDRGVGMRDAPRTGIGMVAMRERAQLLNGRIEFQSPTQGGSRVVLRVPLSPSELDRV
jgi:signal transduction histidine kinase